MADVMLLVTDGGPHPPDKWAALAAKKLGDLIDIDRQSSSDEAAQARKAKPRLMLDWEDALEPLFDTATQDEAARVESGLIATRFDAFDADQYVVGASNAVLAASSATVFAEHFNQPDVQLVVGNILKQVFLDAMNIQRSWAFDAKGL
jgi:hypothetical protein